jgi:hypothetical protein
MSGFELDDVHVGLRAGIRAPLKYVVPLHEYHARRDDVVDVRGVVEIRVDDIVAEHEGEPVERLDFVAAGYGK